MSDQWYYAQDGATQGPMSLAELRLLVESGQARRDGHVWSDGLDDWQPISSLGLFASSKPTAKSKTPPTHAVPRAMQPLVEPPIPAPATAPANAAPLKVREAVQTRGSVATESRGPSTRRDTALSPVAIAVIVVGMLMSGAIGWLLRMATEPTRAPAPDGQVAQRSEVGNSTGAANTSSTPATPSSPFTPPAPRELPVATPPVPTTVTPSPATAPSTVMPPATTPPIPAPPFLAPPSGAVPPSVPPVPPIIPPVAPAVTQSPPIPPSVPAALPSGVTLAAGGQVLFQELDFERQPRFEILGNEIAQDLKYQIVSQLVIDPPDQEGARTVQQTVVDTRLVRSDELSQATFVDALRELKGSRFRYQVTARGEILGLTAIDKGGQQATAVASPINGQGFLVSSVMDKDAWKQVAEWTFFTPRAFTQGARDVTRRVLHDFGPLGSWYGDTHFQPGVARGGFLQIGFVHQLEYQPPQPGRGGALPFTIKKASLKPETAGGVLQYNTSLERVEGAQERFTVRGQVEAEALMQELPVTLSESQLLTMRITDRVPAAK